MADDHRHPLIRCTFSPPPGARKEYVEQLIARLRQSVAKHGLRLVRIERVEGGAVERPEGDR